MHSLIYFNCQSNLGSFDKKRGAEDRQHGKLGIMTLCKEDKWTGLTPPPRPPRGLLLPHSRSEEESLLSPFVWEQGHVFS